MTDSRSCHNHSNISKILRRLDLGVTLSNKPVEGANVATTLPNIIESEVVELTLGHASTLAPPEFQLAWAWFQEHEGEQCRHLPKGPDNPAGMPFPLSAERGIHSPSPKWLSLPYAPGARYALSIHSNGIRRYDDQPVVHRPDGTWTFDYKAHKTSEGKVQSWSLNDPLMNCLRDGIPVGVLIKDPKTGLYDIMGLAFVEQYNPVLDTFTFHGPVNVRTESSRIFSLVRELELDTTGTRELEELRRMAAHDSDERARSYISQVRREGQERFRRNVSKAYTNRCAITGVTIPYVLQAAHIDPYRSKKSQVTPNGILLRADIHILYDSNLLGIRPDDHKIELAESALMEPYAQYHDTILSIPKNAADQPDDELLDLHYQQFKALCAGIA